MLKKNIYIIIEHKNRELLSQLTLTLFAIKKNFRVYIGNYRGIFKLLSKKKEKSGILLMKGGLNEKLTKYVKKKCEKYVVIDQEISPGFKKQTYKRWISSRFLEQTVSSIDLYFCLNQDVLDATYQNKTFKKNKVQTFLSGWPRVDTWRPIFKNLYINKIRSLKKKYGNFIFFSSDFGVTCEEDFEELVNRIPWDSNKKKINQIKTKNILYAKKIFEEYKKFIIFLKKIDKMKNCPPILIRSHPGENLKGWSKDLKNIKNVFLLRPNDVIDPYIFACKGFVHRGSTTAYQAILAKKPISYLHLISRLNKPNTVVPTPFLQFRDNVMRCSKKIKNEKQFISWSKKISGKKSKDQIGIIKQELNINDKFAADMIIDRLNEFHCKKDKSIDNFFKEIGFIDKFIYLIKNTLAIFLFMNKVNYNKAKINKINNGIRSYEIKNIMIKLKKILKNKFFKTLSIKQISESVVEVEKIK